MKNLGLLILASFLLTSVILGMFIEIATTLGAIAGAEIAYFPLSKLMSVILGIVLVYPAFDAFRKSKNTPVSTDQCPVKSGKLAKLLMTNGGLLDTGEIEHSYRLCNTVDGFALMNVAGILSGLLL